MVLVKALQLRVEILEAQGSSNEAQLETDRLFETLKRGGGKQPSQGHPEFQVFYMNLGIDYLDLAQNNLRSGDFKGAEAALERLAQVLPELSAMDRETLTEAYRRLNRQVLAKQGQGRQ
jgi:tetratricopeptide (TPR) repeat protein